MDEVKMAAIIVIACLLMVFGFSVARQDVVDDCERVGAFYVGETVYECKVKPNVKQ